MESRPPLKLDKLQFPEVNSSDHDLDRIATLERVATHHLSLDPKLEGENRWIVTEALGQIIQLQNNLSNNLNKQPPYVVRAHHALDLDFIQRGVAQNTKKLSQFPFTLIPNAGISFQKFSDEGLTPDESLSYYVAGEAISIYKKSLEVERTINGIPYHNDRYGLEPRKILNVLKVDALSFLDYLTKSGATKVIGTKNVDPRCSACAIGNHCKIENRTKSKISISELLREYLLSVSAPFTEGRFATFDNKRQSGIKLSLADFRHGVKHIGNHLNRKVSTVNP